MEGFDTSRYHHTGPNFGPIFLGVGYGCLLLVLGFFAAGGGHGTYVLLGLSSSPLPLLGMLPGIFGGPILWGTIGLALALRKYPLGRRALVALLASHYIGLWPVLTTQEFGDWSHVARVLSAMPLVLALGVALYFGGQALLWFHLLGTSTLPGEAANRRFQFSLRRLLLATTLIAIALACLLRQNTLIQALGVGVASTAAIILVVPSRDH